MATPLSDESVLRKKIEEIHALESGSFDTESVLASIEGILNHDQDPTNQVETLQKIISPTLHESNLDTLPYLLHQITCVLNCKCSGGDSNASTMEILKLLSCYTWEAKIAIVLASFVVEYSQYRLVSELCNDNPFAKLVGIMKHKREDVEEINYVTKFEKIISLVKVSIEVTKFISKFSCLPSKYISNKAEPMVAASSQIPIAVYWITRVVVACASEFTQIFLGQSQTTSSYTETWNIVTLETKITTIQTTFKKQLDFCHMYIEEQKQIKYVEKLKKMFSEIEIHVNNQKILQGLINIKGGNPRPLSCGPDVTVELGVEALKGKTVLLLISNLEISHEEISKLSQFYQESRTNAAFQYEIVWLPIVDKLEQVESLEQRFVEQKSKMPWYALQKLSSLQPGVVRYVREEWRYSKKTIVVALDQRGKMVNQNAYHMLWTCGNSVYPFTHRCEVEIWSSKKEWSLKLLVDETHHQISTWIKEEKFICLYGGEAHEWIQEFIRTAKKVETDAQINLEMVCVGKKTMSNEHITKLKETIAGHTHLWESTESTYFWKRIESMMYSKIHHGAKVGDDPILGEMLHMLTLGEHEQGWALISQGAGKMVRAKGDVILKALAEYESWSVEVKHKGFVVAMNDYIEGHRSVEHHCNRLILPGIEDIPGAVVCAECHRPMEKFIMYRCCTE